MLFENFPAVCGSSVQRQDRFIFFVDLHPIVRTRILEQRRGAFPDRLVFALEKLLSAGGIHDGCRQPAGFDGAQKSWNVLWVREERVEKGLANHWRITLPSVLRQQNGSDIVRLATRQSANSGRLQSGRLQRV